MRLLVALVAVTMFAACSKSDDGPPCAAVVDNMMRVTKAGMAGHGGMEVQNRQAMLAQCEARKMPAAERACLVAATDLGAIASCVKARSPENAQPATK